METLRSFPLNAWYVAAWSHEVGKREPLACTVCAKKMVLWHKSDGSVAALEDVCWHRLAPLSLGWLGEDNVVCRYHGLAFDGKGQCTHMPSQDRLNLQAKIQAYPVVERFRYVWVWPGDPALADPALLPDMHWNDDPEWEGDGKTLHAKCNYRLFVDNLMDLTHESFVHATSIGNEHVAEQPMTTTHSGRSVTSTRWMLDVDAPPFWRAQLNKPGNVDRCRLSASKRPARSC